MADQVAPGAVLFAVLSALGLAVLGWEFFHARRRRWGLWEAAPVGGRAPLWAALLRALWPARFDPERLNFDLAAELRRSGYLYPDPMAYQAAAVRDFGLMLAGGALVAGSLVLALGPAPGVPLGALVGGLVAAYGLWRPRRRLARAARRRAEALPFSMLPALVVVLSLVRSGVGYQRALELVPEEGVFGWLIHRIFLPRLRETGRFDLAYQWALEHLPDPSDPHAVGFLRALRLHHGGRPLDEPLEAVVRSLSRELVERTEARAAVIRRRAGLYGAFAVVGLVASVVLPALLAGFLGFSGAVP